MVRRKINPKAVSAKHVPFGATVEEQHKKLRDAFSAENDPAGNQIEKKADRPQNITQRLAALDRYVRQNPGKPVSDFVRALMPELAAIESRQSVPELRSLLPLPKRPPALWENRRSDDTPMTFFMRTYAPWIGRMYEGDYRRLDQKGYNALRYFLKNPDNLRDPGFCLLRRRDMNERWIAQVEAATELAPMHREGAATYQDLERLAAAMRRRNAAKKARR